LFENAEMQQFAVYNYGKKLLKMKFNYVVFRQPRVISSIHIRDSSQIITTQHNQHFILPQFHEALHEL